MALVGWGRGPTNWFAFIATVVAVAVIWTAIYLFDVSKVGLRAATRRNVGLFVLIGCMVIGMIGHLVIQAIRYGSI